MDRLTKRVFNFYLVDNYPKHCFMHQISDEVVHSLAQWCVFFLRSSSRAVLCNILCFAAVKSTFPFVQNVLFFCPFHWHVQQDTCFCLWDLVTCQVVALYLLSQPRNWNEADVYIWSWPVVDYRHICSMVVIDQSLVRVTLISFLRAINQLLTWHLSFFFVTMWSMEGSVLSVESYPSGLWTFQPVVCNDLACRHSWPQTVYTIIIRLCWPWHRVTRSVEQKSVGIVFSRSFQMISLKFDFLLKPF